METWAIGMVIEDSYGNPAVVLELGTMGARTGKPRTIMQTVGSDRGRLTTPPSLLRVITGERAEWAKDIARAEWTRRGLKRSQFGIK